MLRSSWATTRPLWSASDLADRSIFLTLPPVADGKRQSERDLWQQFELARPRILGVVQGLRTLPAARVDRLPRMADFALWARACETALWPAGTFARAYVANRRAAIESIIEADPIATCVRALMIDRTMWTGSASELLRLCVERARADLSSGTAWAKNPRVLAGRLRREQTFLRTLGIEITFSREGRTGTRMIRVSTSRETATSHQAKSMTYATSTRANCRRWVKR
jgi:hypothetical protein